MLPNKRIRWRHWAYERRRLRTWLCTWLARRLCSRSSGLCRRSSGLRSGYRTWLHTWLRTWLTRRLCSRSSGLCRRLRRRGRLEAVAIGCLADAAVSAGVVGGRHHREALAGDGIATFSGWARVERRRIRRVSSEDSLRPEDNGNSSVEGRGVAPSGAIHIMSVSPGYDASIDFVRYKGVHPSEYCLHAAC